MGKVIKFDPTEKSVEDVLAAAAGAEVAIVIFGMPDDPDIYYSASSNVNRDRVLAWLEIIKFIILRDDIT